MIVASGIAMQFGAKPLFTDVAVKFGGGNRYGLIGANGCGKFTFMKILGGELEPRAGTVAIDSNERVGRLRQDQFAYEGGRVLTRLPVLGPDEEPVSPAYESLYARGADLQVLGAVPGAPVNLRTFSRLLEYALALSAWKQAGGTRWALRVNPSSGNLHPTEGYVLFGGIAELGEAPGLFHYAPREHGLERRADCPEALLAHLTTLPAYGARVKARQRGMDLP